MTDANTDGRTPGHYGGGKRQHWDDAWEMYREAWFVLNVTKYVTRYRTKDGVKDLLKARHYLDKLIELETADLSKPDSTTCPAPEPEADGSADSAEMIRLITERAKLANNIDRCNVRRSPCKPCDDSRRRIEEIDKLLGP